MFHVSFIKKTAQIPGVHVFCQFHEDWAHPVTSRFGRDITCTHVRKRANVASSFGESHHPNEHKLSVVRTLFGRAKSIITEEHLNNEMQHSHYPEWALKKGREQPENPISTSSEVSIHIHVCEPGHAITMENSSWFERGVKEAIYSRAPRPALNKDGGRYQLSHTWDHTLTSLTPTICGVNVSQQ
ncbi:hypothetical protein DPMN_133637 [Dreissena polymorpha]|uniref:Helix-turn-helix domain-containing protein n=1 Tax=Dreissena polymorpha TaxID=45954 RepID=A0A9D4FVX3_DREPO|nr:hypothetical protein DPMN_133637 [Dreissena polymorpha]